MTIPLSQLNDKNISRIIEKSPILYVKSRQGNERRRTKSERTADIMIDERQLRKKVVSTQSWNERKPAKELLLESQAVKEAEKEAKLQKEAAREALRSGDADSRGREQ